MPHVGLGHLLPQYTDFAYHAHHNFYCFDVMSDFTFVLINTKQCRQFL